jgi:ParB/RepB/Spo0J family partition protein
MSGTPTITADATGITATSKLRTGSVVDRLLAPDVAAGPDRVVEIPVGLIEPHPRNPKGRVDDVDDLVASIKSDGLINPIVITPGHVWNDAKPDDCIPVNGTSFVITGGGHRRWSAHIKAGLPTIRAIVRDDFAGAKGRRAALIENLHRQDLDPFDEAEAFAELTTDPYKVSQRDLAAMVGCNQSHISKRLKLRKLPSTIRESVRLDKMTIGDAVELAGVVDNKPVFDVAMTRVTQHRWTGKQAVQVAQREYDASVNQRKAIEKLAEAGIPVVDRGLAYGFYSRKEPCRLVATGITEAKHKAEPCHVAHVDRYDGEVTLGCKEPGRHLEDGPSKLKASKKARAQFATMNRAGGSSDAEDRRARRELKKTYPARMEAAARVVRGVHTLDDRSVDELIRRGIVGQTFHSYEGRAAIWKLVVELVGTIDGSYPQQQHTDKLVAKVPHQWTLLAVAVAYYESKVRANNIRWDDEQRFYLNLLAGQGYELSDVEHGYLGDKRSSAGEWVPPSPAEVEAAKTEDLGDPCRVCGLRADDLEPGVTWVDEDLCSACSDAAEAGWLDPDTTEAVAG